MAMYDMLKAAIIFKSQVKSMVTNGYCTGNTP